ncbi:membrane-associated protein, putative [Bodo saltans]|uniref:Membrane-associated protein, putative n=1 Tax=Bodo saltans TaxID=75058 RepID=A0A0S4IT19_BODSA|nr:membrane-associated protein, putative [Bodo saltans]|eukprot:CUE73353.1 membrane-associated protein, putative [Bodo saltans]
MLTTSRLVLLAFLMFVGTSATTCDVGCAEGYFFSNCTASCVKCSTGFYCSGNLTMPQPCAAGSYNPNETSTSDAACLACDAGSFSSAGASSCQSCEWNQFSLANSSACQNCSAGYVKNSSKSGCVQCPLGQFADSLSGSCKNCSAGYACPSRTVDSEIACTSGTYSYSGLGYCQDCEAGFACPATSTQCSNNATLRNRYACPLGTYASGSQSSCTLCTAMHYCPDPTNATIIACPSGFYSTVGAYNCTICPPGFYCPSNSTTGSPLICGSNTTSGSGAVECSVCPAGFQCPTANTQFACVPGTYSLAGAVTCSTCPNGSYCSSTSVAPIPCPAGTFSIGGVVSYCTACNATTSTGAVYQNATGQSTCHACPAGSYCTNTYSTPIACPVGFISTAGSFSCKSCSAMLNVSSYTISTGSTACSVCPAGSYCPDVMTITPCPLGSYSSSGSYNCTSCPRGYKCPTTTTSAPILCTNGTYSFPGMSSCLLCPTNYMCPDPTVSPVMCPIAQGWYSPIGSSQCYQCPSGTQCALDPQTGNISFHICAAGTYRLTGANLCKLCPPGYMCPYPDFAPIRCPAGMYSIPGQVQCSICPAGRACNNQTAPVLCYQGQYSAAGDMQCHSCPPGYRCPVPWIMPIACLPGQYSEGRATNCTSCPAGWQCPSVANFVGAASVCPVGFYSTGGQTYCTKCSGRYQCPSIYYDIRIPCAPGWYSHSGSLNCSYCPAGYECPNVNGDIVAPRQCQPGSFSDGGKQQCTVCPAGFACPTVTSSNSTVCKNGTFSYPMSTSCTVCAAGHYCPSSAVDAHQPLFGVYGIGAQVPCNPGEFAAAGATQCTKCPTGKYCTSTIASDGAQAACPAGYITAVGSTYVTVGATNCITCPDGSACSGSIVTSSCAAGTYSSGAQCVLCSAGFECTSTTLPPSPCPAGSYSFAGSVSCLPCSAGYVCGVESTTPTPAGSTCPAGSYCPQGTTVAMLCPSGTYGASTGGQSVTTACFDCHAGFYCPAGTAGQGAANQCPSGSYCPAGSPFPTPCPAGTYSNDLQATSRASCVLCPEGYFCPSGTSSFAVNPCPPGFYCPPGTGSGFENGCPIGTYTTEYKLTSASQCYQCPAGSYCPSVGLTAPVPCPSGTYQPETSSVACRPCEAGWACTQIGMTNSFATPCLPGHFCPTGTSSAFANPCPGGTYTFKTNLGSKDQCEVCWRGYACPTGTGYSPYPIPVSCATGHYCPGVPPPSNGKFYYSGSYTGLSTTSSVQYPCPGGTYTGSTDLYDASQCSPCPAGQYCPSGSTTPAGPCATGSFCPPKSWLVQQYPCASGTYQPNTGGRSQSDCLSCTVGNYCPQGSSAVIACPAGSYTPFNRTTGAGPSGLIDSTLCLLCPAGYYCPTGSSAPSYCLPGTYSDSGASSCTTCEVGRYCPQNATSADQKERLFLCPAGLFCPAGLNRVPSAQYEACIVGNYCPLGTAAPVACVPGSYNPVVGRPSIADCLPCTEGFYCSLSGASAVTGECDPGYFCAAGSSSSTQEPCPSRYYRSTPGAASEDFCSVCPRGYYCPEGTSDPIQCTRGYYCVAGTEVPQPCPIGTFGNATMLMSQDDCSACTAGYYCDGLGLAHPTGLCDPGYYCISSAYTSAPPGLPTGGLCPKGGYCPPGSSFPTACAEGTFNNYTGGSTQDDCTSCTPGSYCSGSNLPYPTGLCAAGYYCTGGASLPTQFVTPAGYFSLAGASAPSQCTLGTFNPSPAQGACTACIAGYYCPTTGMVNYLPCPAGGYCVAASVLPRACPAGTYNPSTRQQNISNCLACPAGQYCQETNMTAPSGPCIAGFYCKQYCVTSTCGRYALNYNSVENALSPGYQNNYGGQCPWGYYCPANCANPIACPAGTIRDALQGMTMNDCQACPPRYYCSKVGMSTNIPTNSPQYCSEGYYCPGSINTSTIFGCMDPECATHQGEPCTLDYVDCPNSVPGYNAYLNTFGARACPRGFYCPIGSSRPTLCFVYSGGQTTYQNRYAQSTCVVCPTGYWCDPNVVLSVQLPQSCPVGRFCPPGTSQLQLKCPIGSWSDRTNLGNQTQCKRCPPGRFCPYTGTFTQTQIAMPFCFGGYWCGGGNLNGFGTVGRLGGHGGPCPAGYYCPNGTASNITYACPPGTYKPLPFGSSVGACIVCDPGMYCTGSGKIAVTGKCAPGFYCPRGCSDAYCTNKACTTGLTPYTKGLQGGPCPTGNYCPQTATRGSVLPTPCPAGTFQDQIAKDVCKGCPAGWICAAGAPNPQRCGVGRYCPANTSAESVPRCPPGTFNNYVNAQNISECSLCPAGRYCPYYRLNTSWAYCDPGYYCTSGAVTAQGAVGSQGGIGGICPRGYYCPVGTKYNVSKPCPPGSYNPTNGSSNITACLSCTPGRYCTGWGNYQVTGLCAAGYYCPTGCTDAQCSNKPCHGNCAQPTPYDVIPYASGGICPSGHYCPIGSSSITMCVAGTYAPDSGMSACIACPIGTWCGVRTSLPNPCPTGHYCPVNTTVSYQFECPSGTYNPVVNGTSISSCLLCPNGTYCLNRAMNTSTANCSAGFYCTSGAAFPNGTSGSQGGIGGVCPLGFYCPSGTQYSTQYACHPGTYQPSFQTTNVSACLACTGGFYCPNYNQSAATLKCDAGYYCPTGCSDSTCSNFGCSGNCAVGSWNGGICPAGYICPGTLTRGQISPSACPAGTYSPATGRVSCLNCPPGYYCAPTTIVPKPCPLGRYCPTNTNQNMPRCPAGSYNDMQYGQNLTDCIRCASGKYSTRSGNSSYTALCFPGYYCVSGAVDGRGHHGALGGEGGICPAGYWCGNGTTQPFQNPCPPGTYQPGLGGTNATACLACLPGFYCGSYGMRNVTGPCAAGFYCPTGCIDEFCSQALGCVANVTCPSRACPVGNSCPQRTLVTPVLTIHGATRVGGSITPTPCAAGFYSTSTGLSGCMHCPAGFYCLAGTEAQPNPIICPVGAYCPPGTGTVLPLCPAGSFNPIQGLNSSTQCQLCTPPRVCSSRGMSSPGGICAAGYYCGGGAIDPYGRTGVLGGPQAVYGRDKLGRTICPPGYYCPAGASTPLACNAGTYNPRVGGTNLRHPACCATVVSIAQCQGGDCTSGHYCPNATATPIPCPAGTLASTVGASSCPLCPEGYYCPLGTTTPIICPPGRYCPTGTTTTIPTCPIGSFSNQTGLIAMNQCVRCAGATACTVPGLNASKKTAVPLACPPGTYNPFSYGNSTNACTLCVAGSYCGNSSMTAPSGLCSAGFYCPPGQSSPTPTAFPCPAGYFCTPGTVTPFACAAGTFNNATQGTSSAACLPCPLGMYCLAGENKNGTGLCDGGWYCTGGANSSRPVTNGGECQAGFFCPPGSNRMSNCSGGYYCATPGLTNVTGQCFAGYYCTTGAKVPNPTDGETGNICPRGEYCLIGTTYPGACGVGTYNPLLGQIAPTACISCPAGMYCNGTSTVTPNLNCSAGYYCPPGQTVASPNQFICPKGYYCIPGSKLPVKCAAGTYQDLTGQSSCKTCPSGYYCDPTNLCPGTNFTTPTACPPGYYCLPGTQYPEQYACPSGTYNPSSGLLNQSQCLACPAGKYCPTPGMTAPGPNCANGFYCSGGSNTSSPRNNITGNACPPGYYCPSGVSIPFPCLVGTYNPLYEQFNAQSCLSCPAGLYCPNTSTVNPTLNCSAGYYCPPGQSVSSPPSYACPRGYYCVAGAKLPVRCPAGTYQDITGQSSCKLCPGGYFCNPKNLCPGTNYTTPTICPIGYYCPNGTKSGTQFACPSGTYSANTGLVLASQCTSCPGGKYCPTAGMTAPGPDCSAGFYCTAGSNVSNPRRPPMGGQCPPGSYCTIGSTSPTACPAGTFAPQYGLGLLQDCTTCTAGSYCVASNLTAPTGLCSAGYYCPGGQSSATPAAHQCPVGQVCVTGSTSWQGCPSGTYAAGIGRSQCLTCPTGYYCDQTKPCSLCVTLPCVGNYTCPRSCPLGHYCPPATKFASQFPCPPGRYGQDMNLQNASQCVACPAGQYCPYVGMSELFALQCSPGYFCAGGSFTPKPTDGVTGYRCPIGRYCPLGAVTPLECPRGSYNPLVGGTNISACAKCPSGRACTQDGLTAYDATCSAGYYCPGANPSPSMPQYLCPVGYYCPAGVGAPIPCGSGLWTNTKGQSVCGSCVKGYYCTLGLGALGNVSIPKICPEGYYCPDGTAAAHEHPCPVGTYSVIQGLTAVQNCTRCPGGKACTTPGLSYSIPNCAPGYYCSGGAFVLNPTDHNVTGNICPEGYYCLTGTASPTPCPAGTFSNSTGLSAVNQCQNCSSGMYCGVAALRAPSGECSAGYYCPGGQTTPTPFGLECLGGKYCPAGTTYPLDCPNGTYVPPTLTGRATCFSCPAGFFCNLIQQQLSPYNKPATMVLPVTCPRGYYCRTGTSDDAEYPCLPGTFSNVSGLSLPSDCMACTTGHYCQLPGQTQPGGLCEPGFYCARGSNSSRPDLPAVLPSIGGVCPSGQYCLLGTGEDKGQPCPPGFFYSGIGAKNVTWCQRCRGGYYCGSSGFAVSTGNGMCSEGYYCPGGDKLAANPNFICPVGTYCPQGTQRPIPCPGGTYNPTPGQGYCLSCPEYYFCPRGAAWPTICFSRHVCPAASAYPTICPNGTWAPPSTAAMKSVTECALCPAGVYCTNGTISGKCAAGYLCEYGNVVPDPDTSTDILNRKKGGLCPLGSYCPLGTTVKMPCTNQTVGYSLGLQSASDCSPCRPGYYCIETSVVPIDCPAGYYCPGYVGRSLGLIPCPAGTYNTKMFATDISWCRPCEAGWYCPVDAMASSKVYPSPPGYYSSPGQTEPYPCPGGTYQAKSNGSAIDTAACTPCPIGHYCGPSATSWNQTCPEGTFCPLGSQYPYHCPGGHYCPRNANDPADCPAGYYCPPLSTYPRLCWNGTYCPANTEIPLLCPNGYVSRNDTASRVDLEEACETCPPGTFSTNTLFCELCTAGYVCTGGTNTATPTDQARDGGYICPIGYYCPTGSSAPIACPAGRFNNATGGRTLSACYLCPAGYYGPNVGASTCVSCGSSSTSVAGSAICSCVGEYRSFQPGDGSCRCIPGYVFYSDGQRLSEADSSLPCQPIVYQRCQPGETRTQGGTCTSGANNNTCANCINGSGTIDPTMGICTCTSIVTAQEICDDACLTSTPKIFIDTTNNSMVYYDPTSGTSFSIDLASSGILGTTSCGSGTSTCNVKMVKMDSSGSQGVFNPSLASLTAASTTQSTASFQRRLMQTTAASGDLTISNPIVCLDNGDAMIWDVSDPSRTHYPVYVKDSLLNTNPTFDYTAFRQLGEDLLSPNLTIKTFMYTFTTEGIYVFADNANSAYTTIIRVMSTTEECSNSPFSAVTQTSLVTLGVSRQSDILLAPDWILIGVLMAGLFLLVVGTIGGLWHFRRQTWGVVGTALPKYRNLGMQALARGDFAMLASKGSTTKRQQVLGTGEERVAAPAGSSRVMSLRLDTLMKDFVPNDFIKIVSEEAGVDAANILVLSVTEGTVVRFVIYGLEDSQSSANMLVNRMTDQTNEIHGKLPILAFEEEGQTDSLHPANNMAEVEDDFWDYERQIDLEGFNVRTLYDKLEDQTIHIVSQLVNQRDDVLLLSDKILVESEALKDMFLRIKLELDERNKKEKELQEMRDAKLSTGQIEFDLPEDLKMTLAKFLEDFFAKNAAAFSSQQQVTTQYIDGGVTETVVYEAPEVTTTTNRVGYDGATSMTTTTGELKTTIDDRPYTPSGANDMGDVEGFKDVFGAEGGQIRRSKSKKIVGLSNMRRELRKRVVDLPPECQDDSDCDEAERWERAGRREAQLTMRVSRLRRAMDLVTMPQGLDEREPLPYVLDADQVGPVARQREEYVVQRRAERVNADAIPEHLKDDPSLPMEERATRQVEREKFLTGRMNRMQETLRSLQPPATLLDGENDTLEERGIRVQKREKFLTQKFEKARRARAELLAPAELEDNSDLDDAERLRRQSMREEFVASVFIKNPNVPTLPSLDNPNLSEEARVNVRRAVDEAALRRMAIAHDAMATVGVPQGLSDHSDLSETERQRREEARNGATSTTPVIGRRGPKTKPTTSGSNSASNSLSLQRHEFGVIEAGDKIPREYMDDSDLDEEERTDRRTLRQAFKQGKRATSSVPPEVPEEEGIPATERERRTRVNVAFTRGREAKAARDASTGALSEAAKVLEEAERIGADEEARRYVEIGKQREKEFAAPSMENATSGTQNELHRVQAAFQAGRAAQVLCSVPQELEEDLATSEADRQRRHEGTEWFHKGQQAKKFVEEPDDFADSPSLSDAERARRSQLRLLHQGGRAVQIAREVEAELEHMGFDKKGLQERKNALAKGRQAASANLNEIPTELRDDVPMLSDDEIKRRRELQCIYAQGFRAQRAEMVLDELLSAPNVSQDRKKEFKKVFGQGSAAQQEGIPYELEENPEMTSIEKEVLRNHRQAFLRGRQAARLADVAVNEAFEGAESSRERMSLTAAVEQGRAAQNAMNAVPEEIQDVEGLSDEERQRRQALRNAFQIGKKVRQAGSLPKELPEEEEEEETLTSKVVSKKATLVTKKSGVTFGGETTVELPQEAGLSNEQEKVLNRLKKEHHATYKQLKEKQNAEHSVVFEELEEENIERAKRTDDALTEEFARERKRVESRHTEVLAKTPKEQQDSVKRQQLEELQQLQVSQDRERREAQDLVVRIGQEKKAKMRAILDEKATNEIRLAKTIHNDQDNEVKRIKDDYLLSLRAADIVREEDLKKQKDALLERLRLRERRQKAKANKEKEFLEAQLKQTENLERDTLNNMYREKKARMIAHAREAHANATPEELAEEIERIDRNMQAELESETAKMNSRLIADRLEKEKELADRHAEEKNNELKAAQTEVDQLLEAKRRIAPVKDDAGQEDEKISDGVKRSVGLLLQQQRLRDELQRQRREEADASAKDELSIKQEAQKEIARREKERGERLSDQQKREIIDECRRNAAKMEAALSDDQRRQQEESKKRLEERRRKKEAELHKKQLEEMQAELRRQEDEQQRKAAELSKRIIVKSAPIELPPEVLAEEEEMQLRMARMKEDLRKKHEDEQRILERQLEEELKKAQDKELARIKNDAQKKKLEMQSQQTAKESMQMKEDEKKRLLEEHEVESRRLEEQLNAEAAIQKAKIQDAIEAKRRRKKNELQEKQRVESITVERKQEDEKENFVREAKISNEKKLIDETMRSSNGAQAQDVAQVVMSDRHREEVATLAGRQQKRRIAEQETRENRLEAERQDLISRINARVQTEIDNLPASADHREKRIADLQARAAKTQKEKIAEVEKKHQEETQAFMDQLEVTFAEDQLQLKVRQWNEIAAACGMAAPEQALLKYQQRLAQRASDDAEDELMKFRKDREAEAARLQEKLRSEKEEYDQKIRAEMEKLRHDQDEEFKRREADMMEELKKEKERKEQKLREARLAGTKSETKGPSAQESAEIKKQLLDDFKAGEKMIKEQVERERKEQQSSIENMLKAKREKRKAALDRQAGGGAEETPLQQRVEETIKKASVMETPSISERRHAPMPTPTIAITSSTPSFATPHAQPIGLNSTMMSSTMMSGSPSGESYQQWVTAVVQQLSSSPIMEKLVKIERMLASQVKHGLLSYYLDSKDRQQRTNEGRLETVDFKDLTTPQAVVYCFAQTIRENISRAGIPLPPVKILIAKSLPDTQTNATALGCSYFYDHSRRTMYIRQSRLANIGEFVLVTLHALAHIKSAVADDRANFSAWNDADPSFLTEFYGLLEVSTEEMFYMRMPTNVATRESLPQRNYRQDSVMNSQSLQSLEGQISAMDPERREAFLKTYLLMQ